MNENSQSTYVLHFKHITWDLRLHPNERFFDVSFYLHYLGKCSELSSRASFLVRSTTLLCFLENCCSSELRILRGCYTFKNLDQYLSYIP